MWNIKLKTILYTVTFSVCGGAALTGCSSETPAPSGEKGTFVTLSFESGVEENKPQGRASVIEDALGQNQPNFRWDAGDQVIMWLGSEKKACTFKTVNGGNGVASFSYEGEEVDTKTYFGFYPMQKEVVARQPITVEIPTDGAIRQKQPNSSTHVAPYRAMYTNVVTRAIHSDVLTGVKFLPLTSLVVFKITNQNSETVTYSSVGLRVKEGSNAKVFYQSGTYTPGSNANQLTLPETPTHSSMLLSLGEDNKGMALETQAVAATFMPLLPSADITTLPLQYELKMADGTVLVKDFPSNVLQSIGRFKAGTMYVFNIKHKDNGLVIDSTIISDWEDGGTIVIPIE